ncbi:hypothetical protein LMG26857_03657 [Achromobacter anxifer]|uniref:hypothetical protein n=1 Tax=Achromobacter anxifer TaxID=1287737 RepID=UPI00155BF515|nr:hypothetical protein [Achromobacter anxifer]CAB5514598.1 hypothetical protein LMG26857_03657 [Achromobacter anxifer]
MSSPFLPLAIGLLVILVGFLIQRIRNEKRNNDNLASALRWQEKQYDHAEDEHQKILWCFYGLLEATCAPRGASQSYSTVAVHAALLLVSASQDVRASVFRQGITKADARHKLWADASPTHAKLGADIDALKDPVLNGLWATQTAEAMMQIARYAYAKAQGFSYTCDDRPAHDQTVAAA